MHVTHIAENMNKASLFEIREIAMPCLTPRENNPMLFKFSGRQ